MTADLKELECVGFVLLGEFKLVDSEAGKMRFTCRAETLMDRERICYAFVSNAQVKYIGRAERRLGKRIQEYCQDSKATKKKRQKLHRGLRDDLRNGCKLHIYALPGDGWRGEYGGCPVDLAAGIEPMLIAKFETLTLGWNKRKTG